MKYNQDNNKTEASAQFQVRESSGAKIELDENSTITANGKTPLPNFLDPTLYMWDIEGLQDISFIFTKNGTTTIQNKIETTDVGTAGFGTDFPSVVSKADGFTFTWTGPELKAGETLTAVARKLNSIVKSKEIDSRQMTFTSSELASAETGTLFVTLKRTKEAELDSRDGSAGGVITITYEVSKDLVLSN